MLCPAAQRAWLKERTKTKPPRPNTCSEGTAQTLGYRTLGPVFAETEFLYPVNQKESEEFT